MINHRQSRGFSLIEIFLVIGVIASLALAALVVYPNVSRKIRVQNAVDEIRMAAVGINQVYTSPISNSVDFNGLDVRALINAGIIPSGMVRSRLSPVLKSSLGPPVHLTPEFISGGVAHGISFRMTGSGGNPPLDVKDCIAFANALAKAPIPGFDMMMWGTRSGRSMVCVSESGALPEGWTTASMQDHIVAGCEAQTDTGFSVRMAVPAYNLDNYCKYRAH